MKQEMTQKTKQGKRCNNLNTNDLIVKANLNYLLTISKDYIN